MALPDHEPPRKGVKPRFESLYRPELATEIWAWTAAGKSLAAICRRPGMPTSKTVYNWLKIQPQFAARFRAAQATARLAVRADHMARRAARLARPKRRNCPGGVSGYSAARGEAICDALTAGLSLQAVCARAGMPSVATVYNWLRAYPEFARAYGLARWVQAEALRDAAYDWSLRVGTPSARELSRAGRELRLKTSHLQARVWGLEEGFGRIEVRREHGPPPQGEVARRAGGG